MMGVYESIIKGLNEAIDFATYLTAQDFHQKTWIRMF